MVAPRCKSSDADNFDISKWSCQLLPLREKVKAIVLIKEKKHAMIYGKNKSSTHEIDQLINFIIGMLRVGENSIYSVWYCGLQVRGD